MLSLCSLMVSKLDLSLLFSLLLSRRSSWSWISSCWCFWWDTYRHIHNEGSHFQNDQHWYSLVWLCAEVNVQFKFCYTWYVVMEDDGPLWPWIQSYYLSSKSGRRGNKVWWRTVEHIVLNMTRWCMCPTSSTARMRVCTVSSRSASLPKASSCCFSLLSRSCNSLSHCCWLCRSACIHTHKCMLS